MIGKRNEVPPGPTVGPGVTPGPTVGRGVTPGLGGRGVDPADGPADCPVDGPADSLLEGLGPLEPSTDGELEPSGDGSSDGPPSDTVPDGSDGDPEPVAIEGLSVGDVGADAIWL